MNWSGRSGRAGAEAVIAPRSNRKVEREDGRHPYRDRDPVERFIDRVERCRRIATRNEEAARTYPAFWQLASIVVLLA